VVVKKPVGVVTAAVRSRRATALDITREELKRRRERNLRVFPIHEIDRDASGVLVFARTDEATAELRRQFRSRASDRVYIALIEGEIDPKTPPTTIRSRLIENARGVGQSVEDHEAAPAGPDKPRAAVTHVRPVATRDGLTLVRMRAETDHPYQLRAHMSEAGTPIAGDRAYRSRREDIPRVALHLAEVSFEHPLSGGKVKFSNPGPNPFYELVGKSPPRGAAPSKTVSAEGEAKPTHWDSVSEWYDDLIGGKGNDLYERVLIPGTLDLLSGALGDLRERTVLDIACGQGVLSRALAERGSSVLGFDAAAGLVERARELGDGEGRIEYREGDARAIGSVAGERSFDAAVCLMALMNIDDLGAAMRGAAEALNPGGVFVGVMLHPAFRTPRQTAWGWIGERAEDQRQFRRIDAYLSESSAEITMNPGAAAGGKEAVTTTTFHRPISAVVRAAADAGLMVDRLDEWVSPRESGPGPRADEENRARGEIPMFLALRAVRGIPATGSAPEAPAAM
jgi:23S rRNA-/tRNA-specific pseudouridylate synthase/2-polyprenyl-3-methyl-5-hydroxy-6-metoxy-1,4-benzoquinol methylase